MPTPRRLPARGYELSDQQLSRYMQNNPLRDFLRHYAKSSRVVRFWDFEDWGDSASFTFAQTQTSTNFTVIDGLGGVMAGTTANTTTASVSMIGKTRVVGNNNFYVEGRWKVDTVASTFNIEFGLVDAAPATGAAVVADIDVPTYFTTTTNAAVFGIWNNQTHTSFAFASVGSFTSQTVATTLITAANSSFTTPTADTYLTVGIQGITNSTSKTMLNCWLNGKLVARHEAAAGAINGATSLYPWFYLQTVAAAVKIPTIDYLLVEHDRIAFNATRE